MCDGDDGTRRGDEDGGRCPLLDSRHCAKCFAIIISVNFLQQPYQEVAIFTHFREKETKAQRG